ncbi:SpoIVB peptidase [Acetanaerobacterium elongatum]|uniref:Stage IV sporulation protein B n=1 Tax=Acetanaerobacterium elongatum TaxID=258515 RepID=A0A1H0AG36_9FIRM|nr:SpoIVB peptidase [Acetanaerobacterium elongatum]SDN32281.1 stage IV sporulation protein B [Acetanaerobacterium elongatum]
MKKVVRITSTVCFAMALAIFTAIAAIALQLPDDFLVETGQQLYVDDNIKAGVLQDKLSGQTAAAEKPLLNGKSYKTQLKMFGIIPIKDVNVSVVETRRVIPCGTPFGIKMFTDGVVVVGLTDIDNGSALVNPAKCAGIKLGDIITHVNGKEIGSNEDLAREVVNAEGEPLNVTVRRGSSCFDTMLTPEKAKSDGRFKAGIWVRDSSAGIGTVTFYDESSKLFGGLGHPVCDIDTGGILPLMSGEVVDVTITSVNKGLPGLPGELRGSFNGSKAAGYLITNSETGLYGMLNSSPSSHSSVEVALKQQVHEGKATILSTIEGSEPIEYSIVIEKVNMNDSNPTKNLIVRITDERLLKASGGIVQGMSGSPILQDGMLVGAVTHVFVNDPTRGYGIFAENMLLSADSISADIKNKAS